MLKSTSLKSWFTIIPMTAVMGRDNSMSLCHRRCYKAACHGLGEGADMN